MPTDKKASNNFQKGECYTPAQQRITEGEFGTKLIDPTDKKVGSWHGKLADLASFIVKRTYELISLSQFVHGDGEIHIFEWKTECQQPRVKGAIGIRTLWENLPEIIKLYTLICVFWNDSKWKWRNENENWFCVVSVT